MKKSRTKIITIVILLSVVLFAMFYAIFNRKNGPLDSTENPINISSSEKDENTAKEKPDKDNTASTEKTEPVKPVTKEDVIQKTEEIYEKWLAASMIIAVSMRYSDFEIKDIYYAQETDMSDRMSSQGAILSFMSEGEQVYLISTPLEEENKEKGSVTLYSQDVGFATFEEKTVVESELDEYFKIGMDDLEEIIKQSLLVSIYEN